MFCCCCCYCHRLRQYTGLVTPGAFGMMWTYFSHCSFWAESVALFWFAVGLVMVELGKGKECRVWLSSTTVFLLLQPRNCVLLVFVYCSTAIRVEKDEWYKKVFSEPFCSYTPHLRVVWGWCWCGEAKTVDCEEAHWKELSREWFADPIRWRKVAVCLLNGMREWSYSLLPGVKKCGLDAKMTSGDGERLLSGDDIGNGGCKSDYSMFPRGRERRCQVGAKWFVMMVMVGVYAVI